MKLKTLELVQQLKHLAGKHPQHTHAGGRGSSGGGAAKTTMPAPKGLQKAFSKRIETTPGGEFIVRRTKNPKSYMLMGQRDKRAAHEIMRSMGFIKSKSGGRPGYREIGSDTQVASLTSSDVLEFH